MTLYSFAILPPVSISDALGRIRRRFDPEHALKTVPHVTLKQPFYSESTTIAEGALFRVASDICSNHGPFSLGFDRLELIESERFGCVVSLAVVPSPALNEISSAFVRSVATCGYETPDFDEAEENRAYAPHLTLGQGLSRSQAEDVLGSFVVTNEYDFVARRLAIGRLAPDGAWHRPFELTFSAETRRSAASDTPPMEARAHPRVAPIRSEISGE